MLALIAGRGALPAAVAAAQARAPLVCTLLGNAPAHLPVDVTFRIEHLGTFIDTLLSRGVTDVCFCGAVDRPQVDPTMIDARTMPMVPALAGVGGAGEDSVLRAIIAVFEGAGLTVRGAHELAPDLLPSAGHLTAATAPSDLDLGAAERVSAEQAAQDLGQACVLRDGVVIAREDARGTDAMLADLIAAQPGYSAPTLGGGDPLGAAMDAMGDALDAAANWLSGPGAEARANRSGGVLFKAPKPDQDRRVDLPTIGPRTATQAAEAGLDGIVIAAGGVIVLDQPQVRQILDTMGMFLWVR